MKKLISMIACGMITGLAYGQEPVFQSPYKDGRPVADSLKDYSPTVSINLLNNGGAKANPDLRTGNAATDKKEEKMVQPVFLNTEKKKKN
jgi:hypothetical protein